MSDQLSIDLYYKGALHSRVLKALNARFQMSKKRMNRLHRQWRKNEDQFIAYMPERDVDALRRSKRENTGKPEYTTIVLPYTYAMLMSAHSYWSTVFLARTPVFQYSGRHGETEQQIQAIEALVDYQIQVGRMLVPFYFWLLDAGKYGLGVIGEYWEDEVTRISSYTEIDEIDPIMGVPTGKKTKQMTTEVKRGYSGNKIVNIRPYDYYPDPRVPLWDIQKGEFVGYITEINWNDLLRGKASGRYINVEFLKAENDVYGQAREPGTAQQELPADSGYVLSEQDLLDTGPYGIFTIYVDLAPKEWGLGESPYPEKWVFTCSAQGPQQGDSAGNLKHILEARPLGCLHNKFPIHPLEFEPEAYAFASRGMPEVMEPIQRTMDWLINSHMYNVRKVLNDQFIIDPSRIVMQDYLDGAPGKAIKLKPAAYGTDVRTAISQLPIMDVTKQHLGDITFLHDFAQRAVGVTDQIMGMVNAGGRKTAQEVRTSSTFGVNRQKTVSELMSAMAFGPLGEMLVQNSQQYYDQELKLRIVGDQAQMAGPAFTMVNPDAIAGAYDFVPVDGSMPIDRYQQANLWKEILAGIRQMPEISMKYDIGKIFAWVAQLAGLKNINQFKVQLMPDGSIPGQVAGGNIVPIKKGPSDISRTGEPAQIPNMGTSG